MLKFLLIEEKDNKIFYEYYPEGENASGVISFDKKSKQCNIEKLSSNDMFQRYAMKMMKKLRTFSENESFMKKGIVAWN